MGKYSESLTEHVMSPRNGGSIENPTGAAMLARQLEEHS